MALVALNGDMVPAYTGVAMDQSTADAIDSIFNDATAAAMTWYTALNVPPNVAPGQSSSAPISAPVTRVGTQAAVVSTDNSTLWLVLIGIAVAIFLLLS